MVVSLYQLKCVLPGGCFHREHSPEAYRIIDEALTQFESAESRARFEEHESGPEILVWLAVTTASLTLAKSVVDLIATIVKARSEGIRKGDSPREPLEIIIRGIEPRGRYKEKTVLEIAHFQQLEADRFHRNLDQAIQELYGNSDEDA